MRIGCAGSGFVDTQLTVTPLGKAPDTPAELAMKQLDGVRLCWLDVCHATTLS